MKKLILGAFALSCAASVFAQGTVFFNNRLVGTTVSKIYGPNPTDSNISQSGNGSTDTPAGTTDWSAYTGLTGAGWTVQVWAGPDANSLQGALPTTTMRTGAAAGFVNAATITLTGVAADAASASVQVRVWDNKGGTINSWTDALAAGPTELMGSSAVFTVLKIGGQVNPAPSLDLLTSFNVHAATPEPTTFALAGLGAAALLIFRRRK